MAEWWEAAPLVEQPAQKNWWDDAPLAEPYSGTILPRSRDAQGNVSWDWNAGIPGIIQGAVKSLWSGVTLPGDVLSGKTPLRDEDGRLSMDIIGRSLEGAGVGVGAPAASKGTRSVAEMARAYLAHPDNALTGISPRAVRYARDTFSDPAKQAEFLRELHRLGPEATLADVSPEWMGVARGAASRPGQRDIIVNPLLERDAARNVRLGADLDSALGPAPIPSRVEGELAAGREALGPRYGETMRGANGVDTQALAERLDELIVNTRGPAQANARRVREMLNIPGNRDNLDPHPGALLQTRQAIDGMLATEQNPQVVRILTAARNEVDGELARAVPGIKDVDAQYSELMRQSEGLQRGSQILGSGKEAIRPAEMQQEFAAAALPQGNMVGPSGVPVRVRQGARAEIDRVVGTNANDPAAMQRLVKSEGDWNRDKLRTVFGEDAADAALNAIDRETQFYRTTGRVASGSDTAMAQRFGDFLDEAATPNRIPTDTTAVGAITRGAQKAIQTVMRTNAQAKSDRFAEALGRLAVARGGERDRIVLSLQAAVEARKARGAPTEALENAIRALAAPGSISAAERFAPAHADERP